MNTQSISLTTPSARTRKDVRRIELNHQEFSASFVRWSAAGTVALAVMIAGIWTATNPAVAQFLSAGLWAVGFAFFALAFEVNIKRILPLIATGLVLPILAILGSRVAEEFSILAVAIVAAWLATWVASGISRHK